MVSTLKKNNTCERQRLTFFFFVHFSDLLAVDFPSSPSAMMKFRPTEEAPPDPRRRTGKPRVVPIASAYLFRRRVGRVGSFVGVGTDGDLLTPLECSSSDSSRRDEVRDPFCSCGSGPCPPASVGDRLFFLLGGRSCGGFGRGPVLPGRHRPHQRPVKKR